MVYIVTTYLKGLKKKKLKSDCLPAFLTVGCTLHSQAPPPADTGPAGRPLSTSVCDRLAGCTNSNDPRPLGFGAKHDFSFAADSGSYQDELVRVMEVKMMIHRLTTVTAHICHPSTLAEVGGPQVPGQPTKQAPPPAL